jgi:acetyl esterase
MRRIGRIMKHLPGSSIAGSSPEQIARRSGAPVPEVAASILMGRRPKGVTTVDRSADGVPVRVYTPPGSGADRPVVVYYHGGGFVFGDLRGGDWICGTVAARLDAIVVSVGYRLAPKHPFPAAVDDSSAALLWVADHAHELGVDAARIGVMGDSAGGTLAAVAALTARDSGRPAIRHQALLYPSVGAGGTASRQVNADASILTAADMQKFGELYAGDPEDWRLSCCGRRRSWACHPPSSSWPGTIRLHDDGVLYAEALRAAGVPAELVDYPAMPHGFLSFPRFARDAKGALMRVVASQRVALR